MDALSANAVLNIEGREHRAAALGELYAQAPDKGRRLLLEELVAVFAESPTSALVSLLLDSCGLGKVPVEDRHMVHEALRTHSGRDCSSEYLDLRAPKTSPTEQRELQGGYRTRGPGCCGACEHYLEGLPDFAFCNFACGDPQKETPSENDPFDVLLRAEGDLPAITLDGEDVWRTSAYLVASAEGAEDKLGVQVYVGLLAQSCVHGSRRVRKGVLRRLGVLFSDGGRPLRTRYGWWLSCFDEGADCRPERVAAVGALFWERALAGQDAPPELPLFVQSFSRVACGKSRKSARVREAAREAVLATLGVAMGDVQGDPLAKGVALDVLLHLDHNAVAPGLYSTEDVESELRRLGESWKGFYGDAQTAHDKEVAESSERVLEEVFRLEAEQRPFEKCAQEAAREGGAVVAEALRAIRDDRSQNSVPGFGDASLAQIFARVWSLVSEDASGARAALLQELGDMAGTCPSGHLVRIANALSGFFGGPAVRISAKNEIRASVMGRLLGLLQKEEVPLRELIMEQLQIVAEGAGAAALPELRAFYRRHVPGMLDELRASYVDSGVLDDAEFSAAFREALSSYEGCADGA